MTTTTPITLEPESAPCTPPARAASALHRLLWRIHFWAALATAPVVLFAAGTGILYAFTPQIEAWRHGHLDRVAVGPKRASLDEQVAAAQAALPGQALRHAVPGHAPGDTTQVYFKPPAAGGPAQAGHADHTAHAGHMGQAATAAAPAHDHGMPMGSIAYVDPYTGRVVGTLPEMSRFQTWSKKLHSTALQGDGWRWPMELAASWMLVMFATGLAMWWPRRPAGGGKRGWRAALTPRRGLGGRALLRDLHALFAIAMGAVLCVLFVTGLTWSEHAGARFKAVQKALHQESPRVPKSLRSGGDPAAAPLGWQAALERALPLSPDVSLMLTPPADALGVWRVENFDRTQPRHRFAMALDARSGEPLFRSGWREMPALARATAVGIPFHRGEFGAWNQALLVVAALTLVFSVVSGFAMWWMRRPRGAFAAPTFSRAELGALPRRQRWTIALSAAALAGALPVFGASLLLFALVEAARLLLARPAHAAAASAQAAT